MAPIKFEEHMREKFEERKIQPSANAWEKISGALENSPKEKNKSYMWYAIAASVIGLLIASLFFFMGQNDGDLDSNKIVNQDKSEINTTLEKEQPSIIKATEKQENVLAETNTSSEEKLEATGLEVLKNKKATKNSSSVNELAFTNAVQDKEAIKTKADLLLNDQALIDTKINELIAQVDALELNNTAITDAEINALLLKAQNEILEQRIFKNSNNVDAMALLNEAENELDESFRDQLFNTLKNGFFKVRTAVADRNN